MSVFRHVSAAHGPSCETPVAFFVFNRPRVTARVLAAIAAARPRQLFVICDGPRPNRRDDHQLVQQTRQVCNHIPWQCDVRRIYADKNLGCKTRVSSGLEAVFQHVTRAIILEDDCVPHLAFFRFCEQLLQRYERDTEVVSISGANCLAGNVKSSGRDASYYFSNYFHCWGWATWRRSHAQFDLHLKGWQQFCAEKRLSAVLDNVDERLFWHRVFDLQSEGQINSWAYPWQFSCWQQAGLNITPRVNLISNIGFDASGTHTQAADSRLANLPVADIGTLTHPVSIERDSQADRQMFLRSHFNDRQGLRRWMWIAKQLWAQRQAA
jgi:hypothetical protein